MTLPPVGKHILSELYDCDRSVIARWDRKKLKEAIYQIIQDHHLTQLNAFYHQFDSGGITGLIALAESHIAIHTWPEYSYVTVEVYICNYRKDNSLIAEQLHALLIALFSPGRVEIRSIDR